MSIESRLLLELSDRSADFLVDMQADESELLTRAINYIKKQSMKVSKLESLVKAVEPTECSGIVCNSVDDVNWFDLRNEVGS